MTIQGKRRKQWETKGRKEKGESKEAEGIKNKENSIKKYRDTFKQFSFIKINTSLSSNSGNH